MLPSLQQVERALAMSLNCINRCLFRSLSAACLFSLVYSCFVKCTCRGGDEEEASEQPTLARKRKENHKPKQLSKPGMFTKSLSWAGKSISGAALGIQIRQEVYFLTSVGLANGLKQRHNGNGLKHLPALLNH